MTQVHHSIPKDLVHKAINQTPELKQYPGLRVEVGNAAIEPLDRMRDQSQKATLQLVDMERCYLTVEFFRKLPQDIEKGGNLTQSVYDRYNDSYLRRIVCEAKRSLHDFFYTELGKIDRPHC